MLISGIGSIKNMANGKEFVFKSLNVKKQWEIYQNQLNLKIHHNKKLQNDWNNQGSDDFEFLIIEEVNDEFLLIEVFEDYLLMSNNYNSVEISDFFFEYLSDDTLSLLFQVVGIDSCTSRFEEMLDTYDLSIDFYDEIKEEMISLIDAEIVTAENLMDKLNEILDEKSNENRVILLDLQEKLFNDLHDFTGIGALNPGFIDLLQKNKLSEDIGYIIRENIEELIFLNKVKDNDISIQIEECISIYQNKVNNEIKEELILKADQLQTDEKFLNNLKIHNLSSNNIIGQLKKLISLNMVFKDNFDEKLDEIIENEIEKEWLETKKELNKYLDDKIGQNDINPTLKLNFENNHLDFNLAFEFKDTIAQLIEHKEITNINEIDLKLEELINNAIDEVSKSINSLLIELKENYGDTELSESFKIKLNDAQLSAADGKEFIQILSDEISKFNIKSSKDLENRVDELIFNKNKEILINQFYNLVGNDTNSESFSTKLKNNNLYEKDGNEIRMSLFKTISSEENISEIIDLRNTLELKVDDILTERGKHNQNLLNEVIDEIYSNLTEIIGDKEIKKSFKSRLYQNNLGIEFVDLIKDEINQYIKKDDFQWDFEFKFNQLCELRDTLEKFIEEIIQREAKTRNEEYKLLKLDLLSQLNELIGVDENTEYFNKLLNENNLDKFIAFSIRDEFKEIIDVDEVYYSDKFNYKYEELLFVNEKSLNEILLELVKNQKDIYYNKLSEVRLDLLNDLDSIIGSDSIVESFKNKLYSHELSLDYAQALRDEIEKFINSDDVEDNQYNTKLEELTYFKNKGIGCKIDKILNREYKIKEKEIANLKKQLTEKLNELTDSEEYANNLKSNNLNSKIGNQIKEEVNVLINSDEVFDSKFNYRYEELLGLNVEDELNKLIIDESKIYQDKLVNVRNSVMEIVYSIMGKDKILLSFKNKLSENFLHEDFYFEIKEGLETFIQSDEVFDEKYETKLDELSSFDFDKVWEIIDEIIKSESDLKQKELRDIRTQLNNDLINIIGKKDNEFFTKLLKDNNLNTQTGVNIRSEMVNLINSEDVVDKEYQFKLDELLALKQEGLENHLNNIVKREAEIYNNRLKEIRKKLVMASDSIMSNDSFKNDLYKKQIDDSFINVINDDLDDLINADTPRDNKFEVKLDELNEIYKVGIDSYIDQSIKIEAGIRQKEYVDLRKELSDELYKIIGKDETNILFRYKLLNYKINNETREIIRQKLIELIFSEKPLDNKFKYKLAELKYIKDQGIENIIDETILKEAEIYNKSLKEVREYLIESLNEYIGDNIVNSSLKNKLDSFNLEEEFAFEIKLQLYEIITSDDVSNDKFSGKLDELNDLKNNGIETKIDELMQDEIDRRNAIKKEKLLKKLHDITGSEKLSERFCEKLDKALFDEEFGYEIISRFESQIDSLEIDESLDFEKAIDEMIYNENKEILLNQLYEIIGKESNSEYYVNMLKSFMIPKDKGDEFREKLISFITDSDSDNVVELKKKGMNGAFDELLEKERILRQNLLIELKGKLLKKLNNYVNKNSFKNQLMYNNLDDSYVDIIKKEVQDLIESDEIVGDYEFKVDQLIDIDKKGIEVVIKDSIDKYSNEIDEEIKKLKEKLLNDLKLYSSKLSSNINFDFAGLGLELKKRDLNKKFGEKAISDLKSLINSSMVKNSKFKTKYEELKDIEKVTVKCKLIEYLDKYAEKQKALLNYLKAYLNTYELSYELRKYNMSQDYLDKIEKDITNKIKNEEIVSNFGIEKTISRYIKTESKQQQLALNKLYKIVGSKGISFKFRAKLMMNGLSSSDGRQIINKTENKIKLGQLRVNEVSDEVNRQIKSFSKSTTMKSSITKAPPKYVFCENCGHRNINGNNFCEECGSRLTKLRGGD